MKTKSWLFIAYTLVVFSLGYMTRMSVHKCTPQGGSVDTSYTDTTEYLTWEFGSYYDTTVNAEIIQNGEIDNGSDSDVGGQDDDPCGCKGKTARARVDYEDGEVLEVSFDYDKELFDIIRSPAPRPIRTNFITREITLRDTVYIENDYWISPKVAFGCGLALGIYGTIQIASAFGG